MFPERNLSWNFQLAVMQWKREIPKDSAEARNLIRSKTFAQTLSRYQPGCQDGDLTLSFQRSNCSRRSLAFALLHPETIRRDNNIDNAINTSMHIDNLCLRLLCFSGQFCWRESTADVNTLCSQPTGRGHGRLIQNIWKQPTCEYSLFKRHTPCLMWRQAIKLGHTNTEIERMNCFFKNILSELKEDKVHMMFSVDILSSWKHWFLNCICFCMCCLFTWWRTEYNSNVVFLAHEFEERNLHSRTKYPLTINSSVSSICVCCTLRGHYSSCSSLQLALWHPHPNSLHHIIAQHIII